MLLFANSEPGHEPCTATAIHSHMESCVCIDEVVTIVVCFDHGGGFSNLSVMYKKKMLRVLGSFVGWFLVYG